MKAKNISYPYPVLENEDDVAGEFNPSFRHSLKREKIILRVNFKLKNKTLEKLIKEQKAIFCVELECGSTFFRKNFSTFNKEAEFIIDSSLVREQVAVGFFIRAAKPIKEYTIDGCHFDYEGFSFDIGPGDVLAIGGYTSFIAEKDFDPLKPSVASFMAIQAGSHDTGPMEIDYSNEDKILIKLSLHDWNNYLQIKGKKSIAGILHSTIVLPALADAIRLVLKPEEELQDNHWFQRLEVILRQKKISDDDPLKAAQKVLQNPVERGLSNVMELGNDDE